jgi:hypothetical protein
MAGVSMQSIQRRLEVARRYAQSDATASQFWLPRITQVGQAIQFGDIRSLVATLLDTAEAEKQAVVACIRLGQEGGPPPDRSVIVASELRVAIQMGLTLASQGSGEPLMKIYDELDARQPARHLLLWPLAMIGDPVLKAFITSLNATEVLADLQAERVRTNQESGLPAPSEADIQQLRHSAESVVRGIQSCYEQSLTNHS